MPIKSKRQITIGMGPSMLIATFQIQISLKTATLESLCSHQWKLSLILYLGIKFDPLSAKVRQIFSKCKSTLIQLEVCFFLHHSKTLSSLIYGNKEI